MSFLFDDMLHTIRTYIDKYKLLNEAAPVVVGLSGGADSVALLAMLKRLGYTCVAAHCNFHLRGEESDRDALFAEELAKQFNVPFIKKDFDTTGYASEKHISIEMAARELRYDWFEEIRKDRNAQAIAVAHHRDDSIETMLLNMIRGTGIRGMVGIRPKNGYVVRPLLCVSKEEILDWIEGQQLQFITDSTNLSDEYSRNFIRLRLLPLMEELNPSVRNTLSRTASNLTDAEQIYEYVISNAQRTLIDDQNRISIDDLPTYPAPATILYELLKTYNFTRIVSDEVFKSLDKEPGKEFFSATHRLVKDRNYLLLTPYSPEPGGDIFYTFWPETNKILLPIELNCDKFVLLETFLPEKNKSIAYFDAGKLQYPLVLRKWRKGDWFVPFGMKGRKKLSDYFSDNKFSKLKKEEAWILCSGEDVIWIVGERADNRFRVTDSTKEVLMIKFLG